MPRLTVRPFENRDMHVVARLLAGAHKRYRRQTPYEGMMPGRFTDVGSCSRLIEPLVENRRSLAVVAEQDGELQGFLCGEKQLFGPKDFGALFAEPRSISIPMHGHAVAADVDTERVYTALYGAASREWVADGFYVHNIGVMASDRASVDAWVNVGFGRKSVCAVRPIAGIDVGGGDAAEDPRQEVVLRPLDDSDDELMESFHRRLMTYQTGAPMFWAYAREADGSARDLRRGILQGGEGVAFGAFCAGEPAGMMLFAPPVFLSPLLVPERMLYLWEGYLEPQYRASGVGRALLAHALEVLASSGYAWCSLHFVAGNDQGGPFWLGRGFRPVEYVLKRHVDERVAWAHG